MGSKTKQVAEYGDFQTPEKLAHDVCAMLTEHGVRPASLLEPTCGLGSFLFAGLDHFENVKNAIGADINPQYIKRTSPLFNEDKMPTKHNSWQRTSFLQTGRK